MAKKVNEVITDSVTQVNTKTLCDLPAMAMCNLSVCIILYCDIVSITFAIEHFQCLHYYIFISWFL